MCIYYIYLYIFIHIDIYIYIYIYTHTHRAIYVEYTDCISADGKENTPASVVNIILKYLIVRLHSWNFLEIWNTSSMT